MRIIITLLVLSATFFQVKAQIVATTEDGRKVELNPDGTWRFKEVEKVTPPSDCSGVLELHEDRMTGNKTFFAPKEHIILTKDGETGLAVAWMLIENIIVLSITVDGGGCIDEDDRIYFLFRDGTRYDRKNETRFNCTGRAGVNFGGPYGKKADLTNFTTKQLAAIRVSTSKNIIEENLTNLESQALMEGVVCIKSKL
mgnify:CR=1 FL=1